MPGRLTALWNAFREKRRLSRELSPQAFRSLVREMRELLAMAQTSGLNGREPDGSTFQSVLERIGDDLEQLDRLAAAPEFRALPTTKRMELRAGLLASRQRLLQGIQGAPVPTNRLQ